MNAPAVGGAAGGTGVVGGGVVCARTELASKGANRERAISVPISIGA